MIAVEVEDDRWREIADLEAIARSAAEAALKPFPLEGGSIGIGVDARAATQSPTETPASLEPSDARPALTPIPSPSPFEGEGSLTILLTDDATVQDLNARFRGKDGATNVLSFPAARSAYPHLGDIALAHGVCAREAAEQGKPLADHLRHLVLHGVLHLLGYDHVAGAEAEAMEAMERNLLAAMGVADPYERATSHG